MTEKIIYGTDIQFIVEGLAMEHINESWFRGSLQITLKDYKNTFKAVTGPGRSGAIAAVYASHYLGVPFIPHGSQVPDNLYPLLVIDLLEIPTVSLDTISKSGATIRKAVNKHGDKDVTGLTVFKADKKVRFWFEI